MKLSLYLLALASITFTVADELSDCKCWVGYEPKKEESGKVKCYGIFVLNFMECNVPERPNCKCSGSVNGILSDATGTWCSEYSDDKEQRKWACENKEEWDAFFEKYPNEKP